MKDAEQNNSGESNSAGHMNVIVMRQPACTGMTPAPGGGSIRACQQIDSTGMLKEWRAECAVLDEEIIALKNFAKKVIDEANHHIEDRADSGMPEIESEAAALGVFDV